MTNDWMKRRADINSHEYIEHNKTQKGYCVYRYRDREIEKDN